MFSRLEQAGGREIIAGGQAYLFFGGTAYLGLSTHRPFVELFKQGIDQYGLSNGSSRANNVQLAIYPAAEAVAAERFGAEDALLLSSGFLAAQVAVRHLAPHYEELHYAPLSHPALWTGADPGVGARDFKSWQGQLVEHISRSRKKSFLIISNTLDMLRPERYDFSVFDSLRPGQNVHFLLDDSHGLGVLDCGDTVHSLRSRGFRVTVVASMAKALGVDAGLVLADGETITMLRATQAFRGASPPSPAALYAFVHGGDIYKERLGQLRENIARFVTGIDQGRFQFISQFPVFFSTDQTLYARLVKAGVLISSFPYPSPTDPLYNRIVISAAHTDEDIRKLLHVLGELVRGT